MRKFVLFLMSLLIGWGIVWYVCLNRKAVLPLIGDDELKVQILKIEPIDTTITHKYIGHIEAIHSVSIYPYISGFMDQVLVTGGAEVKAGQTLFILKQDQYLAQVEAAEAKVAGASADLEKAKLYLDRINKTASEAISRTEKDDAQTALLTAEAALREAKAALKLAEVNYNYTVISAPIDGVVGNINATKGEYVSPEGKALAYVLQYNPIRVRFSMPEKDFLNLGADVSFFEKGMLKLKLSNGQIISANGFVRFADNQVQSGTSSIDLFADFENNNHFLLPGAYVTVLYDEKQSQIIMLERGLITMAPGHNYVYVLQNNIIEKKEVELGDFVGSKVVVIKGLNPGDLVITTIIPRSAIGQEAVPLEEIHE
ncbi:MAG: efflux RND transporter periplasmic adaptor subunit [Alphaproteobacteria bacterium]|nr:efflux RND transporter periplasmic adaptor subunit [Alphaproteobacteria bacterium]